MTYEKAIELAKRKDESGYRFLYESTYRNKYYIALKYMQNEEEALDVLQDAYMKAFDKLDTLSEPEKFPAWIGMIVANTAKNALAKKKPLLFSDMTIENEDGASFEYQIEDESIENQPELSYTQEETKELVQELIHSLSDEQRLCILMFHIEDMSIREIADTLGCSENTVKSRLNYGRKNLKVKAEELQKKGYKLYGVAPMPLLLYLLRAENTAFLPAPEIGQLLGFNSFMECFRGMTGFAQQAGDNLAVEQSLSAGGKLAEQVAGKAVKQTFMRTMAGKITVGVATALILTGIVATVIHNQPSSDGESPQTQSNEVGKQEITQTSEIRQNEVTEETTEENAEYKKAYLKVLKEKETSIRKYDWCNQYFQNDELLQTEIYPVAITDVTGDNVPELILQCVDADMEIAAKVEIYSVKEDGNANLIFSGEWDVQAGGGKEGMLFKIEDSDLLYFYQSYGDEYSQDIYIELCPDENGVLQPVECLSLYENFADGSTEYILRGETVDKETGLDAEKTLLSKMKFLCLYNYVNAEGLQKDGVEQESMTYEEALRFLGEDVNDEENQKEIGVDWESAYRTVLNDPVSWLRDTQNIDSALLEELSGYQYTLFDMNKDGTPELIIQAWTADNFVDWFFCTYNMEDDTYLITNKESDFRQSLCICDNELVWFYYDSFSPDIRIIAIDMTPLQIESSTDIYNGVEESAPKTEQLEFYAIEDNSYISKYKDK